MRLRKWILLPVLLLAACQPGAPRDDGVELVDTANVDEAEIMSSDAVVPVPLACMDVDSDSPETRTLTYSNVITSDITGDMSGLEFAFRWNGGVWEGTSRKAAGELGLPRPMEALLVDSASWSISFMIPNSRDTSRFQGSLSCDSLWGTYKTYRTSRDRITSFRRVDKAEN